MNSAVNICKQTFINHTLSIFHWRLSFTKQDNSAWTSTPSHCAPQRRNAHKTPDNFSLSALFQNFLLQIWFEKSRRLQASQASWISVWTLPERLRNRQRFETSHETSSYSHHRRRRKQENIQLCVLSRKVWKGEDAVNTSDASRLNSTKSPLSLPNLHTLIQVEKKSQRSHENKTSQLIV